MLKPSLKTTSSFHTDKRLEESSLKYIESKQEIIHCDELKLIAKVPQKEFQKMGMDAICLVNNKVSVVDFKCMAGLLKTFSQELLNITSGRLGWLLNNELKTDYYMYIYHVLKSEVSSGYYGYDKKIITPENIKYTKAILISKKDVLDIIKEDTGLTSDKIKDFMYDRIIPVFEETGKNKFYYHKEKDKLFATKANGTSNCYFVISDKIHEKPLNIIIPRKLLEEKAVKIWEITEEEGGFPDVYLKNL